MKILTLSQYYYPEHYDRTTDIAEGLANQGHEVTSITAFPNYPYGKIFDGYQMSIRKWEKINGVRILRLPLVPDHSLSIAKRAISYLSFAASATTLGLVFCGPADVMWVYHPPLTIGIPAWVISKIRRIPFVYEIQDMWPETIFDTGMVDKDSLIIRMLNRLANFVYHHAAAITVPSPGFRKNLIQKGVPPDKIYHIPYWVDEELFEPVERDEGLGKTYGLSGRFNIVFAGNIGPAQCLTTVVEAASHLKDLSDLQFVLIGSGLDLPKLKAAVEENSLDNVRFIDRQPITKMASFFAWADVLFVSLSNAPLFQITIPSKIFGCLASARPILCAASGDAAELIRDSGAGLTCEPENAIALEQSIRALYSMPKQTLEALGQAGRNTFLGKYTRNILLEKYRVLLEEIGQRR